MRKTFILLLLTSCLLLTGCQSGKHISDKDLEGVWYSTVSESTSITFHVKEGSYTSNDFYVSGRYRLKPDRTIYLEDAFGEGTILTPIWEETAGWVLIYDDTYFPIKFTRSVPETKEETPDMTTGDYDRTALICETICEILTANPWICDGEGKTLSFGTKTYSYCEKTEVPFSFTSAQIYDGEYHFTLSSTDGDIAGRIMPLYNEEVSVHVPIGYTLDWIINGQEFIRASYVIAGSDRGQDK